MTLVMERKAGEWIEIALFVEVVGPLHRKRERGSEVDAENRLAASGPLGPMSA